MGRKFTVIFEQFCCTIDVGEFVKQTSKDRFLAKVRIDEVGCWIWTASQNGQGYGVFRLDKSQVLSHRAAWVLFVGSIPDAKVVRHKCDIKLCVNPNHLLLGTCHDNHVDMLNRKRSTRKLTEAQVEMVIRSRSLGSKYLADLLNVSRTVICHIWQGRAYAVVTGLQKPPIISIL
jgi:hypothetical protein